MQQGWSNNDRMGCLQKPGPAGLNDETATAKIQYCPISSVRTPLSIFSGILTVLAHDHHETAAVRRIL